MSTDPELFSVAGQRRQFERSGAAFDVAVIGGGITGAAVARDASLRGLKTVLFEKGDFASGTSSRSSHLIHGGLRYLEYFNFRLVYESVMERHRLMKLLPDLVKPMRFTLPIYRGQGRGFLAYGAGLVAYDLLSLFTSPHRPWLFGKRTLSRLEPAVLAGAMRGGATLYDGWVDDARLTLRLIQSAASTGAVALSYCPVTGLRKEGGRLRGVLARDLATGTERECNASVIVNATGPWTDWTCGLDGSEAGRKVRLTKGTHLTLAASRLAVNSAVMMAGRDGRVLFVIPAGPVVLAGTTDCDYRGELDEVHATGDEADYILEALGRTFSGGPFTRRDVLATFAGVRPLVFKEGLVEAAVPRDHAILESPTGLLTVTGGKLTTHRLMAEQVLNVAARRLEREHGVRAGPCVTARVRPAQPPPMPPAPSESVVEGLPYQWQQLVHGVRHEFVHRLEDFFRRRTMLSLIAPAAVRAAAPRAAELAGAELGWSPDERAGQLAALHAALDLQERFREGR